MKEINSNILSDITVHMKYAKYNPDLQRRETWNELVDRNELYGYESLEDFYHLTNLEVYKEILKNK